MRTPRLILLLLLTPFVLSAQEQLLRLPDFPKTRYEGGAEAFYRHMGKNLRYPRGARESGIIGTSVVAFTLLPEGEVTDFEIVNSMGDEIDENIRQVFSHTQENWLASPDNVAARLYLPITYTIDGVKLLQIPPDEDLFIEKIQVVAYGRIRSSVPREKLIEKMYKAIEKKKHTKALRVAGELLRRDPFNKEWYVVRSSIYSEMGEPESVCQELVKIRDFLQYPVAEKLLQQYCQ